MDPVDIQIQHVTNPGDNNGAGPRLILAPEDSVYEVLDRLFPNRSMSIADALLITTVQASEDHAKRASTVFGLNITNSFIDGLPNVGFDELQPENQYTRPTQPLVSQTLESFLLGSSFSLAKSSVPDHAKTSSTGSFVKSTPNNGARDMDGGLSSRQSSIDSPSSSGELRSSFDSPRESSASPTGANSLYASPSSQSYQFPPVMKNSNTSETYVPGTTRNSVASGNGLNVPETVPGDAHVKRSNSQVRESIGNGVILLPRKFRNQNPATTSRKTGPTRLGLDAVNATVNVNSTVNQEKQAQSAPSFVTVNNENQPASSAQRTQPKPASLPKEEIHHTKAGAYQRIIKPSVPTVQIDGVPLEMPKLNSRQDEPTSMGVALHADGDDRSTARKASKKEDTPVSKDRKPNPTKIASARLSQSPSCTNLTKVNIPPSHARHSREASSHRPGVHSVGPVADVHMDSINNNRKLLLSINRGISPYTTVVPQINVLIVEDNVINQKILETFLRKRKIRSSTAKNGKEAIEKWQKGGFHLVLMDIQLPVMSGIEATKKIRRLEHQNRIGVFSNAESELSSEETNPDDIKPQEVLDTKMFRSPIIIVALTASSSLADKSDALAAGCNDFLTKPVNLKWLEQKTIEWGCMQALIDFEGWKHWVSKEPAVSNTASKAATSGPGAGRKIAGSAITKQALERVRSSSNLRHTLGTVTSARAPEKPGSSTAGKPAMEDKKSPRLDHSPSGLGNASSLVSLNLPPLTPASTVTGLPTTHTATALVKSSLLIGNNGQYAEHEKGGHAHMSLPPSNAAPMLLRTQAMSRPSSAGSKKSRCATPAP